MLRSARGDLDGGIALARRNRELTEQLGDVFSRSLAIANMAVAELAMDDHASALDSIEEAERLYRGAMGNGGEMESWRGGVRAEALRGVGRTRRASEVARERGMLWSLPLSLLALGRAEAEGGDAGAARRALDEGATVAKRTGAKEKLAEIEVERDLLPAGAR